MSAPARDVVVHPTVDALMRAAADEFAAAAATAVRSTGRFAVALAGGSTPRRLYALLATPPYADAIAWEHAEVFFGDERCVPPDDPASNYGMAREALLAHVPVPPERIHRIRGEDPPDIAAAAYERELRAAFATPTGPPRATPRHCFDLVLLGMGDNGHTLSLFPRSPSLHEHERWVVAVRVDARPPARITLTAPVANAAWLALFLVAGADKAAMLRRVLEGPPDPDVLPAQLIAPQTGRTRWLVDAAAAAQLAADGR